MPENRARRGSFRWQCQESRVPAGVEGEVAERQLPLARASIAESPQQGAIRLDEQMDPPELKTLKRQGAG